MWETNGMGDRPEQLLLHKAHVEEHNVAIKGFEHEPEVNENKAIDSLLCLATGFIATEE